MKHYLIILFTLLAASFSSISVASEVLPVKDTPAKTRPELQLANIYQPGINLQDYWVSEKLDGVRAYWDGKQLVSRQGNVFQAPQWFTDSLPESALDGELWIGRSQFEQVSGLVRRQIPDDALWLNVKYMVFDLPVSAFQGSVPESALSFDERLKHLEKIISSANAAHLQLIRQFKVTSQEALMNQLDDIVKQGGEGLMLHLGSSLYQSGRSDDLLKLKKYFDAEAVVVKQIPGKGKYRGMLGSLLVETKDKKLFKIGSGFTDAQRKNPPAIGSTITYKYFGLSSNGIPRFASFLRVRNKI